MARECSRVLRTTGLDLGAHLRRCLTIKCTAGKTPMIRSRHTLRDLFLTIRQNNIGNRMLMVSAMNSDSDTKIMWLKVIIKTENHCFIAVPSYQLVINPEKCTKKTMMSQYLGIIKLVRIRNKIIRPAPVRKTKKTHAITAK